MAPPSTAPDPGHGVLPTSTRWFSEVTTLVVYALSDAAMQGESVGAASEVRPVGNMGINRIIDVVFVHGLGGDPLDTWSRKSSPDTFWPGWLAEDLPSIGVWTAGYPASPSRWRGSAMSLEDRALNLLAQLDAVELGVRPLVFVAHSLGGLIVKQVALCSDLGMGGYHQISEQLAAVIFIATPHDGSRMATYLENLSLLTRPSAAIGDLRDSQPHLLFLGDWYRENAVRLGLETLTFFETKPTRGAMIVDAASSNPGIAGSRRIPVDADHLSICKPQSRSNIVYSQVVRLLGRQLATFSLADAARSSVAPKQPRISRSLASGDASPSSDRPTTLTIENTTASVIEVHWVTQSGRLRHISNLASNQSRTFDTFVGHKWAVFDREALCLGVYQAQVQPYTAQVESL